MADKPKPPPRDDQAPAEHGPETMAILEELGAFRPRPKHPGAFVTSDLETEADLLGHSTS